jgi:hypothetical protein
MLRQRGLLLQLQEVSCSAVLHAKRKPAMTLGGEAHRA